MPKAVMNPYLKEFWATPSRIKVLYGGRASGKSYDTASHAIRLARMAKLKFLCIRQFQANIKESVYTLLKNRIYDFGLQDEFIILHNTIKHKYTDSEFIFYGVARNIEEIKSTEGVDVMWSEESALLTKEQYDIIAPTIRKEHSELWFVFNPRNRSDYIWQKLVEHQSPSTLVKKMNYTENPFLSDTMLRVIEEAKEEDEDEYRHIYLGVPREGDEKALFSYDEIEKAMDNSLERVQNIDMTGVFSYALDVARYGNDSSVITKRRGYRIYDMQSYKGYSTMELANTVNGVFYNEPGKKPNGVFIDVIGVGAGVYDRLDELGIRSIEANVSMKAEDTDTYYNKRAEMYFNLRDWIRKGGIIPNDADLKEELLAIRYIFNKTNGKIMIQPKDEIKELIGRSPDKSDSIALHFFSHISPAAKDMAAIQKEIFRRRR